MTAATVAPFANRVTRRLFVLVTVVLLLSSFSIAYLTLKEFNRLLTPELSRKAELIGQIVGADVQRATDYGIPFDQLVGADEYLATVVDAYDELAYIALVDRTGKLLYQGGEVDQKLQDLLKQTSSLHADFTELPQSLNYAFPIRDKGELLGFVDIGIDKGFVQRQLDDIVYDIVVILLVALLVAFEVMLALILLYVTGPMERLNLLMGLQAQGDFSRYLLTRARDPVGQVARYLSDGAKRLNERYQALSQRLAERLEGRQATERGTANAAVLHKDIGTRFGLLKGLTPLLRATANDVRVPLFIFAFAEELQKSFLPLFVRSLYEPIPGLSEAVVIGLPIAVYLAVLAVAAPYAGVWSDRYGSRKIFLIGLIPAVAGFIGCGFAQTVYELMWWRATTGLGYAMITIASQSYVFGLDTAKSRARTISVFVAVIMSATMCGTAIGGILADRVGYRLVFLLAGVLAIVSGMMAYQMLTRELGAKEAVPQKSTGSLAKIWTVLTNARFVVFLFFAAIPANVLAAAYLWYLVPLYLFDLGASPAEIGRIMMIYYLLVFALGPLASHLVDRFGGLAWVVGLGSLLSGIGLVAFYDWRSIWAVVLAVIIMGVSHALTRAPQFALALEICQHEIELVGRTTVLNFLRSAERVGMIAGLLLSAILLGRYGYHASIGVIGIVVSGAAVLFVLSYPLTRSGKRTPA